jgi:hypothetical protein
VLNCVNFVERLAHAWKEIITKNFMSQENEIEEENPSLTKDFLPSDGASYSASFGTMQDAYLRIIDAPWKQGTRGPNGCPIIGNAKGTMVCMLAHSANHRDQQEEAETNARLIEAAPRMLSGLIEIAKQHLAAEMDDHTSENADWEGGYDAIVKIARAALESLPNAEVSAPK